MIRMVVFDMAGTTVDEDNVVYKSIKLAMEQEGLGVSLDKVLAEGAGKEKLQAIRSILQAHFHTKDQALAGKIFTRFQSILKNAYLALPVRPQPHAVEVFAALRAKHIFCVLNTGYNAETANGLLKKLGWQEGVEFDTLVTATDTDNTRPDPDMIFIAMRRLGLSDAKQVVKVGDSIIDIEEGKNAGCILSIGITTGAHTRNQLASANPDYIIDDLQELIPLLS